MITKSLRQVTLKCIGSLARYHPGRLFLHEQTLPGGGVTDRAWWGRTMAGGPPAATQSVGLLSSLESFCPSGKELRAFLPHDCNDEVSDQWCPLVGAPHPPLEDAIVCPLLSGRAWPGSPRATPGFSLLSGCFTCRLPSECIQPFVCPEATQSSL